VIKQLQHAIIFKGPLLETDLTGCSYLRRAARVARHIPREVVCTCKW